MAEKIAISFGDTVRVIETPSTVEAGVAGLAGSVSGETTPSVTNVDVIGELEEDFAFNVYFEEKQLGYWFDPGLLEFVDHAAGTEITLDGVDKKWVRTDTGEWEVESLSKSRKSIWRKIVGLFSEK